MKKQMTLSVFDLSTYLGVNPDTIKRWVRQGKLPVLPKGADLRFQKKDLEKWAALHNIRLNLTDKKSAEKQTPVDIPLSQALQNGGIYCDIPGNDVAAVLASCVKKIPQVPDDFKPDLLDRLVERENAFSTGVGNGMAIPHPRQQLSYLPHPMITVNFLSHPVDYNALDGRPVSILFCILCPSLQYHLHLLSALSFCLKDADFVAFIKSRPQMDQLVEKTMILQKSNPL
ncbi:MAG: PTS sugar transporter subunit IIA [Desulfotignum sp.]|nr:PTS sugar transporter subunit IIA [Desulfotignum sp.]MCF8113320.1 PTS sugar transporter subunit IIA [Desulfotignum sp.]MCF8125783.1 PTS sugar transporter subunit IIA [Desulfotignum sp.]